MLHVVYKLVGLIFCQDHWNLKRYSCFHLPFGAPLTAMKIGTKKTNWFRRTSADLNIITMVCEAVILRIALYHKPRGSFVNCSSDLHCYISTTQNRLVRWYHVIPSNQSALCTDYIMMVQWTTRKFPWYHQVTIFVEGTVNA